MSINLDLEKICKLSCMEQYEIMDFAMQAAEDNGFINSFIFERALYLYAAIVLFQERKEEIAAAIAESLPQAWTKFVEDGTIEQLINDYPDDMNMLADNAQRWYDEYVTYAHSARGLLDTIKIFSGDIVESAANRLVNSTDGDISKILDIADSWGMNRNLNN